jgi:hypothetical protein
MAASKYNFHLSIYSNCEKIVGTEVYLKTKRGSISQHFLDCAIDRHYPIALCLDPTKTDQEVLLALIESLSNDAAQSAYKVNLIKACRDINITPDMLSCFGLLPAIQYSSATNIVGVTAQNENGVVIASPAIPSQSSVIAVEEIPIAKKAEEDEDEDEDYEDDEDDEESQMSDEEYLASKRHLLVLENIK